MCVTVTKDETGIGRPDIAITDMPLVMAYQLWHISYGILVPSTKDETGIGVE